MVTIYLMLFAKVWGSVLAGDKATFNFAQDWIITFSGHFRHQITFKSPDWPPLFLFLSFFLLNSESFSIYFESLWI